MGNRLVPARWTVRTARGVRLAQKIRRTNIRIALADFNAVLIHMVSVHAVQMAVVEIIRVAVMFDSLMTAAGPMNVRMRLVDGMFAGHDLSPLITRIASAAGGGCRTMEH